MNKVSVEIDSHVNELFSKTKVTQKFKNQSQNPIELKIYIDKNDNIIFSSFNAKIGDSISVQSKVIKKEKAEIKYVDSISSGNAAIFVSEDPYDNKIVINMGNIPANEEVTFISEFIQFIEVSKSYEFEMFRNLPIFKGKDDYYQNNELKGKITIEAKNTIIKLEKEILMKELNINEEKYLNEDKNKYLISYEIKQLPNYNNYREYIPSSKIYFEIEFNQELNEPLIYSQKSKINKNELNYIIQYKNKITKKQNENRFEMKPALFIFLIDQSGSMSGSAIRIASKGLKLFLQSLPPKSYYQIIGFGSKYVKYDETPKEYTQENIKKSIEIIDNLYANLGGTNIYDPLNYIYNSHELHDKIQLPRNIFLLTDGEIEDKKETLDLIYKNSSKYFIYSIGIGNYFDEDLIKNAGIIGKGSYHFCKDLENINSTIVKAIRNSIMPYCENLNIKSSLDTENLIKNDSIPNILRDNQIIILNYIINDKNINHNNKINLEIYYLLNNEKIDKKYEMKSLQLSDGEELSKLIINNYLNKSNLDEENKIKLSLKYQVFTKNTSLFAEIELSDKITEEMKKEIIGNKDNNKIERTSNPIFNIMNMNQMSMNPMIMNPMSMNQMSMNPISMYPMSMNPMVNQMNMNQMNMNPMANQMNMSPMMMGNPMMGMNNSIMGMNNQMMNSPTMGNPMMGIGSPFMNMSNQMMGMSNPMMNNMMQQSMQKSLKNRMQMQMNLNSTNIEHKSKEISLEKSNINKKVDEIKKIDLNKKDDIMLIINSQDFINGFWEINEITGIIKEKYKKEYDLLKGIKNNKIIINDKVAITILIIYFINREHPELLDELLMVITKAKIFISNEVKETYENIIKEIGIN